MKIKSRIKDYEVTFCNNFSTNIQKYLNDDCYFLIDYNVFNLYYDDLKTINTNNTYTIKAVEENKTIAEVEKIVNFLLEKGIRRNSKIVAIGGGITQDLACFTSSILFRGVQWVFYPTTLLAQCDSCIGSKSSINIGKYKNQLGTFYPPQEIIIDLQFLKTLSEEDIYSGVGEAIKVHYLDPNMSHDLLFDKYTDLYSAKGVMTEIIKNSLLIKKNIIEIDEFDTDYRNIMNYGHTFGHALEACTDYSIPHGICVSIGMSIANHVSHQMGLLSTNDYLKMGKLLEKHNNKFKFDFNAEMQDKYWSALKRDKKNIGNNIGCILTKGFGKMFKMQMPLTENVKEEIVLFINKR